MANVNLVILSGNVGGDVDLRYFADNTPVANISLATNKEWTDKDGKVNKKTEWHTVVYVGKHAEVLVKKFKLGKGDTIHVAGELYYEEFEDKNNNEKRVAKIKAKEITYMKDAKGKNKDNEE